MGAQAGKAQANEDVIQPRAFSVALHARTLVLLSHLQAAEVPVPGAPGNEYAVQVARESGYESFDVELVRAADQHDWVLAEILMRLQTGDTAGMSLVDFLPPSTVLALWHAMPQARRKYLRAVFGTQASARPPDVRPGERPTPRQFRDEGLAMLDRLVDGSNEEIKAAESLLAMLATSSRKVDDALAQMNGTPGAQQVREARAFTQALLDAAEDGGDDFDAAAWLDGHLPPERPMPPIPDNYKEDA